MLPMIPTRKLETKTGREHSGQIFARKSIPIFKSYVLPSYDILKMKSDESRISDRQCRSVCDELYTPSLILLFESRWV
jgi:hypothetical protein